MLSIPVASKVSNLMINTIYPVAPATAAAGNRILQDMNILCYDAKKFVVKFFVGLS